MCEALRELMKEDLDAARASGEEIGKEIGKEIGEKNGEQNMIRKALKNNRSAEEVAEFLNIPLEEVKVIERQICNR